ncbi:MAG: helix-turn-helix domain-containing protein [Rhodospirillaceae bacterium]|nr:helix-turn-helix domain-containing protein [Rhodospirillaceae bacterium]MBT5939234.1 helix-turn-helix domain-containing protein [Rhodospirillaceae bacterium]MBT7265858.1 helix-turn-helix domain-containing protein [Rhodospirillaceae bacterium]
MSSIGRLYDRDSSSIYPILSRMGSIRPPIRKRSPLTLTLSERKEISRGIVAQQSIRSMALSLGRSPSTVSHEVGRNGGYSKYRAALADERAWDRARRPKQCKLAKSPWLRRTVSKKLRRHWSPEQILPRCLTVIIRPILSIPTKKYLTSSLDINGSNNT